MPNCRRCKIPLKPVRKVIGPKDAVIVGYHCDKCRYYDSLWSAVGLDQNGIGGKGRGERE